MATSPKGVQGPSADDVTRRLGETVDGADNVLRLAFELEARFEKVKAGLLGRERERLARKYGGGSSEAARAEAAVGRQRQVLDSAVSEAQTARIPMAPLDAETTRVHGRAVDQRRAGIAGIDARLLDEAGVALAKAVTDENGYFRLDVKPRTKARPKAGKRRIAVPHSAPEGTAEPAEGAAWDLVLSRGQQELARESLRDLGPGQAVYRELMVERQ